MLKTQKRNHSTLIITVANDSIILILLRFPSIRFNKPNAFAGVAPRVEVINYAILPFAKDTSRNWVCAVIGIRHPDVHAGKIIINNGHLLLLLLCGSRLAFGLAFRFPLFQGFLGEREDGEVAVFNRAQVAIGDFHILLDILVILAVFGKRQSRQLQTVGFRAEGNSAPGLLLSPVEDAIAVQVWVFQIHTVDAVGEPRVDGLEVGLHVELLSVGLRFYYNQRSIKSKLQNEKI